MKRERIEQRGIWERSKRLKTHMERGNRRKKEKENTRSEEKMKRQEKLL